MRLVARRSYTDIKRRFLKKRLQNGGHKCTTTDRLLYT